MDFFYNLVSNLINYYDEYSELEANPYECFTLLDGYLTPSIATCVPLVLAAHNTTAS